MRGVVYRCTDIDQVKTVIFSLDDPKERRAFKEIKNTLKSRIEDYGVVYIRLNNNSWSYSVYKDTGIEIKEFYEFKSYVNAKGMRIIK